MDEPLLRPLSAVRRRPSRGEVSVQDERNGEFARGDPLRQRLREIRNRLLAIGGDQVAERGEKRHMGEYVRLDAGPQRVLPDRRETRERLALLQAELLRILLGQMVHFAPDARFVPRVA